MNEFIVSNVLLLCVYTYRYAFFFLFIFRVGFCISRFLPYRDEVIERDFIIGGTLGRIE